MKIGYHVTISTQNGSSMCRGHNIRDPKVVLKEGHIDLSRPHEIWLDEEQEHAYKRLFKDAVKEYNEQVKSKGHPERVIEDYYRKIKKDKTKHTAYEMVIGVYHSELEASKRREILKEFVDTWKERNPNLEIIGAYYHDDEEGKDPHVHIDYIPVAEGYTRGMKKQTSITKALEQQGFVKEGRRTAQIQWERRENDYLESLCKERGLIVDHPIRDKGIKAVHLDTPQYKAYQEDLKLVKEENKALQEENKALEKKKDSLEKEIEALEKKSLRKVKTDKYDWYQEFIAREYNLPPNKIDTDPRFRFNKFEKSYAEYLDTLLAEEIPRERGQSRF